MDDRRDCTKWVYTLDNIGEHVDPGTDEKGTYRDAISSSCPNGCERIVSQGLAEYMPWIHEQTPPSKGTTWPAQIAAAAYGAHL